MGMPQVVEPDVWQAGPPREAVEALGYHVDIVQPPILPGEKESLVVLPLGLVGHPLLQLGASPLLQCGHRLTVEVDSAPSLAPF